MQFTRFSKEKESETPKFCPLWVQALPVDLTTSKRRFPLIAKAVFLLVNSITVCSICSRWNVGVAATHRRHRSCLVVRTFRPYCGHRLLYCAECGPRGGAEVAQVYVRDSTFRCSAPSERAKGFRGSEFEAE